MVTINPINDAPVINSIAPDSAIEDIEYLRFLELGIDIKTLKMSNMSLAVDTPEDVIEAKKLITELNLN